MSSFSKQLSISLIISYTFSIGAWYLYNCYVQYKANKIPNKWKRVATVEKIILYPLKSAGLREVESAECTELGLRETDNNLKDATRYLFLDRSFVIYEVETGKALNLSKHPKVVLINVESIDSDHVVFKAPDMENLTLKLSHIVTLSRVKVDNYGVKFDAVDCGDDAAEWMSCYFTSQENTHRLGYYAENIIQRPDPIGTTLQEEGFSSVYKHWRKNDGGAYSHLTSYNIVSSSSIKDLNSKLLPEDKCIYGNLRPNILVDDCEKYAEDKWKWIKIGEKVILRTIKPCTRCTTITVNFRTGQRNQKIEPLKTLKSYRTIKHLTGQELQSDLPVLGINVGLYEPGEIHIGDPIYIDV